MDSRKTLKTFIGDNGKLQTGKSSRKNKKALSWGKRKPGKKYWELDSVPKSVKEALKDFPLPRAKTYFNKEDLKDIRKYGISFGDVFNAGEHLYYQIAVSLHVYEKFLVGHPADYKSEILPLNDDYEDHNWKLRSQMYAQDLRRLRNEFVWLHTTDPYFPDFTDEETSDLGLRPKKDKKKGKSLFLQSDPVKEKKRREKAERHQAEYSRRKKEAFNQLIDMIDSMWI